MTTPAVQHIKVSDLISVSRYDRGGGVSANLHLNQTIRGADGEFLTNTTILPLEVARGLTEAIGTLLDVHPSEVAMVTTE